MRMTNNSTQKILTLSKEQAWALRTVINFIDMDKLRENAADEIRNMTPADITTALGWYENELDIIRSLKVML